MGGTLMTITITELKNNVSKYLELAQKEEVLITKRGKVIAQLSKPKKLIALDDLVGIAKGDSEVSLEEIKKERLAKQ